MGMGMAVLITSNSDKHFLHVNVLLRHARSESGDSERDLETILTEAATGKRRLWVSSLLFAELRPSAFVPVRFPNLIEFVRYLRSIATFVTPDPNTMLRAGRLRDVKWQRPAALRRPGEKPRFLSMVDAIQLASALWVKETADVANLEFLAFDDRVAEDAESGARLSLLRLQDYADDTIDFDVAAAVRLARAEPVLQSNPRQPVAAA
jgi:hypothetical protein